MSAKSLLSLSCPSVPRTAGLGAKNQIVPGSVSSFTVQCLLEYKYYIYPTLPLSSIIAPELTRRKDNIHLVSLIKEAYLDKVVCTRVRVP